MDSKRAFSSGARLTVSLVPRLYQFEKILLCPVLRSGLIVLKHLQGHVDEMAQR